MYYIQEYESSLGRIVLASDGECLTGLWFENQKHFGSTLPDEYEEKELSIFALAREWLDGYFAGMNPDGLPPLRLSGTPFQLAVWEILQRIPYGETVTYGDIARVIARWRGVSTMSAQAVGNAVGRNPISILVPCHRVVGSNGSLTGYAGGMERKQALLRLEQKGLSLNR